MKLLLHPSTKQLLSAASVNTKGSYIFHGPPAIGKFAAAIELARQLNCRGDQPTACANCLAFSRDSYPDLIIVSPDGSSIGIDQIQTMQQQLSLSLYAEGGRRVVIIDSADELTTEAQNCLLKTLEEPPADTVIVLITQELNRLLPTIQSRCNTVYFCKPSTADTLKFLQTQKVAEAEQLIELSNGTIGIALNLAADAELRQHYQQAAALSQAVLSASRFERLLTAAKLAELPDASQTFIRQLAQRISRQLRQASDQAAVARAVGQLQAIERFSQWRASNVNLKPALESLMMEL